MLIQEKFSETERILYAKPYNFIKGYCTALEYKNALKALPLCTMVHNGQYRRTTVDFMDTKYREPYCTHCLRVTSSLISLNLPLKHEELDVMLASALLHDTLEDQPQLFPDGGRELVKDFGLSEEVLENVKVLTKKPNGTKKEMELYFDGIKHNKLCLMIKLADRSHNTESLYVMTPEKIQEYIEESREDIFQIATYGKAHYPELSNGITILKSKIASLIDTTEALCFIYGKT